MSWVEEVCAAAYCGARDAAALDAAQMGALSTGSTAAAAETACRAALARGAEALEDELLRWPRGAARSLVSHAARTDDGDAVAVLCRVGGAAPDDDETDAAYQPLHRACKNNNWGAAATLVHCGANVTRRNVHGETPADAARRFGHVPLAVALDAGLDAPMANGATLRAYASRRAAGYASAGYCVAARNREETDRRRPHLRPAPALLAGVAPAAGGAPDVADSYELVVTTTTPSSGAKKGDAVALPCTIGRGECLELRDTSCVVRIVAEAVVPAPGDAPSVRVRREGTRQKNSWAEPRKRQAVAVGGRSVPKGCGARLAVGEALRVGRTTLELRAVSAPAPVPAPAPPPTPVPTVATVVAGRPTTSDAYAQALIERAGAAIDAERGRLRQRLAAAAAPEQTAAAPTITPPPGATDAERWRLRQRLAAAAAEQPAALPPDDDGHVRVWELVAPKRDTAGIGHVPTPTGPSSTRAPNRRAAEMALARHRYDRGPAASSRPAGGVAFVRTAAPEDVSVWAPNSKWEPVPVRGWDAKTLERIHVPAFGVALNDEDAGPSDLPPVPAPFELRPAPPKRRRTSPNKRVAFSSE